MTREEIGKAIALASAATPGPWGHQAGVFGARANSLWSTHESDDPFNCPLVVSHLHSAPQDAADFALMAASRTLVPGLASTCLELLARAEKAESLQAYEEQECGSWSRSFSEVVSARDKANARADKADKENVSLRNTVKRAVEALGSAACVSADSSVAFLAFVPNEVRNTVDDLRARAEAAEKMVRDADCEAGVKDATIARLRAWIENSIVFEMVFEYEGQGSHSDGWSCGECDSGDGPFLTRESVTHSEGCVLTVYTTQKEGPK